MSFSSQDTAISPCTAIWLNAECLSNKENSLKALLTIVVLAFFCAGAGATTYYVDPAGSNANDGLSPQTAWRTLLKVGVSTFLPGDVILFKRDAVWNEWLTPPSSGAAGNLIKFDAYGNGRPPEFTGQYATTATQWSNTSGSVWQIALTATQAISQLKFVQFGSIWGNSQVTQAALAHNRDWFYDSVNQILYAFSSTGNPVTAFGSVTPIILSAQSLINLNNVTYVEIQHLRLDWYDGYGVQVQGASDHIWLANMTADSQVPNATVPIGFYVHPSGTPGDIHLYNTDSHRNYVGYRFDGTPTAIELKNCRAYANRTYGLMECRWSDFGWGPANDQNLAGRFTTQTFTLPRLAKVQDYFLRQFDASVPPRYSRVSAALHINYPY
jgi:hypothetical protein